MKTGICKLCNQTKPLLKKSHIIPDFFYVQAGLYNEKHQIHKISVQRFIKDKKVSFIPTGVYEGGMLCETCDNDLLGGLETYGRKVLFGGLKPNEEIACKNFRNRNDGFEYSICENVDYKKFKLFLLSILWRAAISTNTVFNDVDLSENHVEILRSMLFEMNPGQYNDFPIITMSNVKNNSIPSDLIGQPIKSEIHERILITFLLSDFIFVFHVAPNFKDTESIKYFTPSEKNRFGLMHIPKNHAWNFILKYTNVIK
jgi:hypothetical protein